MLGMDMALLVCEDNPVNTLVLQEMLETFGFDVTCAEDGHAGLEQFAGTPFPLVLTDIEMPRVDGFGVLSGVRQVERQSGRQRSIVVAVTAHATPHDRARFLNAGFDDFLAKPFRIDDIRALLHRVDPSLVTISPSEGA